VVGLDATDGSTRHRLLAATVRLRDGETLLVTGENGVAAAPTSAADARHAALVGTTIVTLAEAPADADDSSGVALWTWDLTDPAKPPARHPLPVCTTTHVWVYVRASVCVCVCAWRTRALRWGWRRYRRRRRQRCVACAWRRCRAARWRW
jgi:hypothetical protein